jgi:quercetin dioxygenase-like cupin family protein
MNFETCLIDLPVQPLIDVIAKHPDWWNDITIRQDFTGSAHRDTQCIFLRGPDDFLSFFVVGARDYPLMEECVNEVEQAVVPLIDATDCEELGRILIVKLPAGKSLIPHRDEGDYAAHYSRFHIVLTTNDSCVMTVGEEQHARMRAGDAFWFNHRVNHSFVNHGDTDRIHLIVDLVTPHYTVDAIP